MSARTLFDFLGVDPEVERALVESGGEVTPEVEGMLARWDEDRDRKVDGYCALISRFRALARELGDEERRVANYRRHCENAARGLQGRLLAFLEALGEDKVLTRRHRVSACENARPTIRWSREPEDIPGEFLRVRLEPDLEVARDVLDRGGALPEGFEVSRGKHVRIS